MLARMVLASRAAGVSSIHLLGAGSGNHTNGPKSETTGYAAWPRYGFDGTIPIGEALNRIRQAHPDLAEVSTFSEAYFHPNLVARNEARAAWSIYGTYAILRLDLTNPTALSHFVEYLNHTQRATGRNAENYNLQTVFTRNGGYEYP